MLNENTEDGQMKSGWLKTNRLCCFLESGEPSRTRTCDPLVKSQLLYRLSYRPTILSQRFEENLRRILPTAHSNVQKDELLTRNSLQVWCIDEAPAPQH